MTLVLSFVGVIIVLACADRVVLGNASDSVPLIDCSTEIDILFLYFDGRDEGQFLNQWLLFYQFVGDLLGISPNTLPPRATFAQVIDRFSILNPHVNVSSWSFHAYHTSDAYGLDEQKVRKHRYTNMQETVRLKITFLQRLFSEMGGVRKNVSHIAVIFLDGTSVSYDDVINIPTMTQRQDIDLNIFVVVMAGSYITETVQVRNTLVLDRRVYFSATHVLTLAFCDRCVEGWFPSEYNNSSRPLSCYKLLDPVEKNDWNEAWGTCIVQGAQLVAIETKAELLFLQNKMTELFKYFFNFSDIANDLLQLSTFVFIGLARDKHSTAKRFNWKFVNIDSRRPLLVYHWAAGRPSLGRGSGCGVWQFVWNNDSFAFSNSMNNHSNETVSSSNEDNFVDGWVDISCKAKLLAFNLCEMAIPRRIDDTNLIRIRPAGNESFNQALVDGDFRIFRDNIVSVPSNTEDIEFSTFIQQTEGEFPLFNCGVNEQEPRFISYARVCDNIDHCDNRRDETFCTSKPHEVAKIEDPFSFMCVGVNCCDGSCLPSQWVNDGEIDCFVCGHFLEYKVHDESEIVIKSLNRDEDCGLFCNLIECVKRSKLTDEKVECTWKWDKLDETIEQLEAADTCSSFYGQRIWAPKCVYVRDMFDAVIGCRDMSHLQNCSDFECPEGYAQCPNSYCIPQHYVLDGKTDCPTGEDERNDVQVMCSRNFDCWNSPMCLHPDLVCDGQPHCPHGDDESDCYVRCAAGFHCVSGTVTVRDYNRSIPLRDFYFISRETRYVDLSGVDMSAVYYSSLSLAINVIVVVWSNCRINDSIMMSFQILSRVREMDLSYNLIQAIDGSYINYYPMKLVRHLNLSYNRELAVVKDLQMTFLETLDLSYTALSDVDDSFIIGLTNLKHIDLSFTFITGFQRFVFPPGLVLLTLDLRGLYTDNVYEDQFNSLTITQHLYADSFELCCSNVRGTNIPLHTCHAPDNAISSCFDLVRFNVQRVLLWVVAVLAVLGNTIVIVYRVFLDRSALRTGYGLFVTILGISDFIMGVYLFIIAGADYYYRGVYVLFYKSWRESSLCKLAGFLATLSSESSILFIFLITFDRFLIMKFPFGQVKLSRLSKAIAVLLCSLIGFGIALTPVVLNLEINRSNSMCLGLPLTTTRMKGWLFSFVVFIVFNLFLCLIIAYGQRSIFQAMAENRIKGASSSTPRRPVDIMVAKQLSLVAMFSFLCWFPIGIMGLVSLSGHEISNEAYAWTTFLVIPVNSAANPLLYTVPALMDKWDKFRRGGKMISCISK